MEYDHKLITKILDNEEQNYILLQKLHKAEIKEKSAKLLALQELIQSKDMISVDDFDAIRKLAISSGGFLTKELRQLFYRKIFLINEITTSYDLVFIDANKNPDIRIDNYELNAFIMQSDVFDVDRTKDSKIILADVSRSKINMIIAKNKNMIIKPNQPEKIGKVIKDKLQRFITEMTSINNSSYNYFQGYHDIGLYFLFLYYDKHYRYAVESFQRFSEFFLKENLLNRSEGYTFNNTLRILKEVLMIIDENVWEVIDNHFNGTITFAISWILTCFTHNINDSALQYRLIDYFLVSHPISIYHLSALIIIDELRKLCNDDNNMNETSYYLHFQNLDIEKIDFDKYIIKTEESMEKYKFDKIKVVMKELNMKHCFPLINNESYTRKWIQYNNAKNESFYWYLKGKFKAVWPF